MTTTYIGRHRNDLPLTTERAAYLIERAYRDLHADLPRYAPVRLADLRAHVAADRALFDQAIATLSRRDGVHLRSQADQKTLTGADHLAAVTVAGTERHTLYIEP